MSNPLKDPIADIIRVLLTQESGALFSVPAPNVVWPLYVASLPDDPNKAACLTDTEGKLAARYLDSGGNKKMYGIQLRTRATVYTDAIAAAFWAENLWENVSMKAVSVGSNSYTIDTIIQTSPILAMGYDAKRRANFSLNALVLLIGA